jgi:hypothetical protein
VIRVSWGELFAQFRAIQVAPADRRESVPAARVVTVVGHVTQREPSSDVTHVDG